MSTKKIKTRDRILSAAVNLLEAKDRNEVRMSDIAKAAGISRQALYLHFETRADLLIETTYYLDRIFGSDERLEESRRAGSGVERLDAFIKAWGGYIPKIYNVASALIAMKTTDEEAAAAWDKRMQDVREGCEAAILALHTDQTFRAEYSVQDATDILWAMLSVGNWEKYRIECGWDQEKYIDHLLQIARRLFVKENSELV